jgi:hypothetical protein
MANIGIGSQITTTPPSGGGGLQSRTTANISQSVTTGAVYTGTVTLAKTFALLIVSTNVTCRLRLYATAAAASSDANRGTTPPPQGYQGLEIICDIVLNATTGLTWVLSPEALGSDGSGSPTGVISYNLTNLSSTTQTMNLTLTYLKLET